MHTIHAYNAAAAINLADYAVRAHRLRRGTAERVTATREAIDLSQALIAKIDALVAGLASELMRKGGLWPAYRSAPSEPEIEAELLSAAQWRDNAQESARSSQNNARSGRPPDDARNRNALRKSGLAG